MATFQNAAMPTTATGKKYAAAGIPLYSGGPNPQIFVDPKSTNPNPVNPQLPPPQYQPLGAFEYSGYSNPNYHQDPAFMAGWDETLSAIGALDPATRKRFEDALAEAGPVQPGMGRGIDLLRSTYNSVIGGQMPAAETPPIVNPSLPQASDTGARVPVDMTSMGAKPMVQQPQRVPSAGPVPTTGPGIQGGQVSGPQGRPSTGLQGRPAGRRGGRGGGKARRAERPSPTLPNEGGQMPPARQAPQMPGFIRAGRGLAY